MDMQIGFGTTPQDIHIDDDNLYAILLPNEVEILDTGAAEVLRALKNPIGAPAIGEVVKPGEKVVIITSDITRPVPSYKIIPSILDALAYAGCSMDDITVVFALGSHRAHTEEEKRKLVGDAVYNRVNCIDGDPKDFVHMGVTKAGTPVDVTRIVAQADRRIGVGNVEFHYFAGYSGGAKAIMPGVSTRDAIQSNHSMMVRDTAIAGQLETNPVRMDIEEAVGDHCPLDYIVNVVLDSKKEIIHAAAGDFIKAHREACLFLDKLYKKDIEQKADIVIASQGGAPKDLNLYQTQKALDNSKNAVRDGGIIILVGSCKEGLGERVFEEWMTAAKTSEELIERIEKDFQLGGHKAAAIALVLKKAEIYLVSEMDPDFVRSIFMVPFANVTDAYKAAQEKLGADSQVIVMPYGGSTLPVSE
ncbi:MAG: nickel-dependent lactate racemase [Clostridiales Family XIII bacterium]|jgi:nickel-dependent lactate racemase|nr:nickel-dependent lactate racemase [Clostridiales Family XIII bacterium]